MVLVTQFLLLAIEMLQMHSAQTNASDNNSCCTTEHYEMYLRSSDKMTKVDQHRCVMRPSNSLRRVAHCCCQATFVLEVSISMQAFENIRLELELKAEECQLSFDLKLTYNFDYLSKKYTAQCLTIKLLLEFTIMFS